MLGNFRYQFDVGRICQSRGKAGAADDLDVYAPVSQHTINCNILRMVFAFDIEADAANGEGSIAIRMACAYGLESLRVRDRMADLTWQADTVFDQIGYITDFDLLVFDAVQAVHAAIENLLAEQDMHQHHTIELCLPVPMADWCGDTDDIQGAIERNLLTIGPDFLDRVATQVRMRLLWCP